MALPYRRMGMRAEAVACLEKALELAKGDFEAIKLIGPELADTYDQPGQTEALISRLEQEYPGYAERQREWEGASQQTKPAAQEVLYKGYDLQHERRYAEAVTAFQDAIQRYPDYMRLLQSAHICIAECLQKLGKPAEAIAHLQQVYDQQADLRPSALYGQATVYFEERDYARAAAAMERLFADQPYSEYAQLRAKDLLAESYIRGGKVDQGVSVLRSLLAGSDERAKTILLYRIGEACFDAEKWQAAADAYDGLAASGAIASIEGKARYRAAICYDKLGDHARARRGMQDLIGKFPDSLWAKRAQDWLAGAGAGGAQ